MSEQPIVIAESKFLRLVRRGNWEYVTRQRASGVVIVAPLTADRQVVFVEEFRPPIGKQTIEFPAGIAGDIEGSESESLEDAARRELWEETGYRAKTLKQVFLGPSSAGLTDETCAMFVALNAVREGEGGGDESERINVHHVPLDEVDAFLQEKQLNGFAVGARVYAGLYFLHRELAS